jgi:hypothetical protein
LLDSRTALIGTWLRGRRQRRVTEWLTKDQSKAVGAALESLCTRGVVVEEKHKALGLFPMRRNPEASVSLTDAAVGSAGWEGCEEASAEGAGRAATVSRGHSGGP